MSTEKILLILGALAVVAFAVISYTKRRDAALIEQAHADAAATEKKAAHDFTLMHFLTGG